MRDHKYRLKFDNDTALGATGNGESNIVIVDAMVEKSWQVGGTFAATVKLYGRADPDFDFEELDSTTAKKLAAVPLSLHSIKVVVSNYTSGSVKVVLRGFFAHFTSVS